MRVLHVHCTRVAYPLILEALTKAFAQSFQVFMLFGMVVSLGLAIALVAGLAARGVLPSDLRRMAIGGCMCC